MASSWFDLLVTSHYQEEPCACPAHHLLSQAGLQSTETVPRQSRLPSVPAGDRTSHVTIRSGHPSPFQSATQNSPPTLSPGISTRSFPSASLGRPGPPRFLYQ